MWAARSAQRHCRRAVSLLQSRNLLPAPLPLARNANHGMQAPAACGVGAAMVPPLCGISGARFMSMERGSSSMRSKVERRMRRETGKTLREIRRARKLRKKLMTDEERLMYNLRRAKKKVALLLQKLKKYELPELPAPRHDPELLTPEQLQAYRKIGFRNRNYVPVGVRGVFGGVVQNMHLHWKFHETVQVCCDNFPKEKIKDMATMLARLSGGIVVNIHDVKTIIMFRGRNYRQPKNLIPINTLTKRKALFKARFEQALESQKLNIKKLEQELRRKGVNPEDPVALASIQRVAATFFRAIDEKQGTPYVFQGERSPTSPKKVAAAAAAVAAEEEDEGIPPEDSDQEELDRFIAEIEEAADREWAEEEAAEKEESSKIRYWAKGSGDGGGSGGEPDYSGRSRRAAEVRRWVSDDEDSGVSAGEGFDSDVELLDGGPEEGSRSGGGRCLETGNSRPRREEGSRAGSFRERRAPPSRGRRADPGWDSGSDSGVWEARTRNRVQGQGWRSDDAVTSEGSDEEAWGSDGEDAPSPRPPGARSVYDYQSSSGEEG